MQVKIGSLPKNPAGAAIYMRQNGQTYFRLNESLHVKATLNVANGSWTMNGSAEKIDPEEVVEVIHPAR
jgi:hypothetical protein